MSEFKKLGSWLGTWVAAFALLFQVTTASAQIEIKLPLNVNLTQLRGKMLKQFADDYEKSTNKRYKVSIYPGGQLYSGAKAAKAVQLGNVQMACEPNSAFTAYTKNAEIIELPFGFSGAKEFQEYLSLIHI